MCSEDNAEPGRYCPVTLFHSGPADDDRTASVYAERQVLAAPGQYHVTFRARERHVTDWTQLTSAGRPATIDAGPPSDNAALWDPQLRRVRNLTPYYTLCGLVAVYKGKGKGFPYSIPSVGPGADPGVQAVSLQVTVSHPPGGRLPLLSARPAVTSPAAEHHRPLPGTKLYCLVTEAHRCKQLA